jgi:hypothetical protein
MVDTPVNSVALRKPSILRNAQKNASNLPDFRDAKLCIAQNWLIFQYLSQSSMNAGHNNTSAPLSGDKGMFGFPARATPF